MNVRTQWIAAGFAALGFAGAVLVAWSGSERPSAVETVPDVDPHAAAGVVTAGGPEVAAAFDVRVVELEARLDSAPDDRSALLALARLLHDGHRTQDAVALYERAIALDPGDAQPYYDLASARAVLADWAGARAVLEGRLAQVPRDAVAMYNLGAVEANAGDSEAAALWWARAREIATSADLRARLDEALSRLGSAPEPPRPR